jgi:GLPGLI family protein
MKKILLLLTFICIIKVHSQDSRKLTVDYNLFIGDNSEGLKNDDLRNAISLESGNLNFKLFINDTISYYVAINGISSEKLAAKLAVIKTKYVTPIYCNTDKNFLFTNSPGFRFFKIQEYLINKKKIEDWLITNESKIIDGNVCYKATATDIDYAGRGQNKFEISAWFCPKIPFSFGPVYYGNLPGLILEISYLDVKLLATKIEYHLDDKKIAKPEGNKKITIADYYTEMSKTINEIKKEMENQKTTNPRSY